MFLGLKLGLPLATEPKPTSILQRLQSFGGLAFYKNYVSSQVNANADYSIGSGTATVTAARSGSSPATYFNSSGGILVLTTANVPRWTQGYYDSTGFHSKPGILIESGGALATGRNNIIQSADFTDIAWVATTVTVAGGVVDGVLAATVSTLSATAPSSKIIQAVVDAVAGKYTASIFIKRKTGTGTISLRANTADTATDITAFVGTNWTRVQVTSSSAINPTFELDIDTSGDEVYVFGAQLEKHPNMTSYIPTTTGAVTRAAEKLTYAILNNRTVAIETIFVKFTALYANFANDGVIRTLSDTDTKARPLQKANTSTALRITPNSTDNSTVNATATTGATAGTSFIAAANMRDASINPDLFPYVRIYSNGAKENSYTTGAYTDNAWGTNFYIGSAAAGNNQINGIIESVAIYSTWQDDPSVNAISYILSPSSVAVHSYLLNPTSPPTSANLVSGAAGNGNVSANTGYMWQDFYACTDVGWTKESQTGENFLLFQQRGADSEQIIGCSSPVGDIFVRTYTKSTNTMSASPTAIFSDATYAAKGIFVQRNPGESFFRLYFNAFERAVSTTATKVFMMKSTDLTGTSWGAPVTIMNDTTDGFGGWLNTESINKKLLVIMSTTSQGTKAALFQTTDNGDTFTLYSTIPGTSGTNGEGSFINDPDGGGKILGVMRKSTGDYLLQVSSADYGLTWSSISSTGLGASTGAKVQPKLIISAGDLSRVTTYFYDRGDNRLKISAPTKFANAYAGNWLSTYLIGTSSQGNGGIMPIDFSLRRYIVSTATGAEPDNAMNWWVFKDLYTWVAQ